MGTTSDKLTYLATTKTKIKDAINLGDANITTETFRQYEKKIKQALINTMLDKWGIWDNFEKVTGTNTSLSLSPTSLAPISIDLKGNTQQDSTTGKNLFNFPNTDKVGSGLTSNLNGTTLTISGTATATSFVLSNDEDSDLSAGTYTFSTTTPVPTRTILRFYDSNGTILNSYSIAAGTNSVTFTLDGTEAKYKLIFNPANGGTYNYSTNIQLEKNGEATTYEPYTGGSPSPSPSYPQDIHVVSGDNTIEICGKNLFNVTDFEAQFVNNKILNDNGVEVSDSQSKYSKYMIFLRANTTYHIKGWWQRVYYFDENKVFKSRTSANDTKNYNYTPTENEYIEFQIRTEFWSANKGQEQVEIGNTASTYTPYVSQSQLISLGNIELNKISTYQDYIYKDSDKWYLHKEIGKYVLTGEESNDQYWWSNEVNGLRFRLPVDNSIKSVANAPTYCNRFNQWYSGTTANNYIRLNRTTSSDYLGFWFGSLSISGVSSVATFKTYASSNDIILYYPLETPTNTEITDSTLLEQLEAIKNMTSYNGTTNISQRNNDLGFILDIKAIKEI